MTRRALALLLTLALAAGCGDAADDAAVPDRAPDVTGVVATPGAAAEPVLVDASDPYYEGMSLLRGDPVVLGAGGDAAPADLRAGVPVEVWTAGACAESYPVQCEILAVRVLD